jgi:8-oxo-dGTP pyrophosphatase MutT (NUDIX family)
VGQELRPWNSLASELVVDNRWYRLRRDTVRLPSGFVVDDYYAAELPDVALVFALREDDRVVFVRQWRQGRRSFCTELPGGSVDEGEAPVESAARELREETGYVCPELREIGRFELDATKSSNLIVAFLGLGAEPSAEPAWDDQEELEVELIPRRQLESAVRAGEITPAGTVATVYRALDELGRMAAS